ncbi:MAG: hypothetical protein AB7P00_14650, partial [Sandaracinaceae bacterium]
AAEAFESAVEESVARHQSAAAKKIRSANAASSSTPADTEFNRYVARKKAETAGPPSEPSTPNASRARVSLDDDPDEDDARDEELEELEASTKRDRRHGA